MQDVHAALANLAAAARQLADAELERQTAMRERDAALRSARDAGATWDMLAEAAGISRVTISKALDRA